MLASHVLSIIFFIWSGHLYLYICHVCLYLYIFNSLMQPIALSTKGTAELDQIVSIRLRRKALCSTKYCGWPMRLLSCRRMRLLRRLRLEIRAGDESAIANFHESADSLVVRIGQCLRLSPIDSAGCR